jgi:hypothetical protein
LKTNAALLCMLLCSVRPACGQVSVLTHHNDNARSGANLAETTLTVSKITRESFGKLAYRIVDGNIYAQPLIVSGAKGSDGGTKPIAIVATESNSVYAFDADNVDQNSNAQLWKKNLGPAIDYHDLRCGCSRREICYSAPERTRHRGAQWEEMPARYAILAIISELRVV